MTRRNSTDGRVKRVLACMVLAAVLMIDGSETKSSQVMGAGGASCGQWMEGRRPGAPWETAYFHLQWVLGFLSGIGLVNQNGDDPLNGMDVSGVQVWIDNYCRANPVKAIVEAAVAFKVAHPR